MYFTGSYFNKNGFKVLEKPDLTTTRFLLFGFLIFRHLDVKSLGPNTIPSSV